MWGEKILVLPYPVVGVTLVYVYLLYGRPYMMLLQAIGIASLDFACVCSVWIYRFSHFGVSELRPKFAISIHGILCIALGHTGRGEDYSPDYHPWSAEAEGGR